MSALRWSAGVRLFVVPRARRTPRRARNFASLKPISSLFAPLDTFPNRHIGPDDHETSQMLSALGYDSFDAFIADTVPQQIRVENTVTNGTIPPLSESELHRRAKALGGQNDKFKSYIGMGYHNAVVPPVILRNVSITSCVCVSE